jgi:hypothetical protein
MPDRRWGLDEQVEDEWQGFRTRLADRLAGLEDDEILLLEVVTGVDEIEVLGATPYLQFRGWGDGMVRAEAVSNVFLADGFELSEEQEDDLERIGWNPEDYDAECEPVRGRENFWIDTQRACADWLAVISVRALREVYGCLHPAFLEVTASDDDEPLVPPAPEPEPAAPEEPEEAFAQMPHDREHLQAIVDAALEVMFEDGAAEHDDDGDLPIRCGQSVVFVLVRDDRPAVEIFAEVVVGLSDTEAVADELDRLNRHDPDRQFFRRGERVVARQLINAWPFAPDQLRLCVQLFCDGLDELAAELVERIGGHRFLDPELLPRDRRRTDEVTPAMRGLLELMELGHVPSANVAALFDHDRDQLVRALEWVDGGGLDEEGLDEEGAEVVKDRLRRGLRVVVDQQAKRHSGRPERRRSQQLSLSNVEEDGQESLDDGRWGREVS